MTDFGQSSSGDFNTSSSALRVLYEGTRQTYGTNLTPDSFTQTNPPVILWTGR